MDLKELTIPHALVNNSRKHPSRTFLTLLDENLEEQSWTYLEFLAVAARWMGLYHQKGFGPRSGVVIILPHSIEMYGAYTGALMGGVVPAMFSFPSQKFSAKEYLKSLGTLLQNADPDLIVVHGKYKGIVDQVVSKLPRRIPLVDPLETRDVNPHGAFVQMSCPNPDDVAFLQYSSGTTGIRKGVAITHRALFEQLRRYGEAIGLNQEDRIVSWLPLYHDMGLICCYFLPLLMNVPLAAMSPFDWVRQPLMLLKAIDRYRSTLCWIPNFAYNFLAKYIKDEDAESLDLSSIRGLVNCSEPVRAESHRVFLARFCKFGFRPEALGASFAMAENTFAVTSGGFDEPLHYEYIDGRLLAESGIAFPVSPVHPHAKLMTSSGAPLADTQVEILSEEGFPLPRRRVGEITIRSGSLFGGYVHNAEATAKSLRDGAFCTGDLGYLAGDHLFVTGRKKDLIILAGKNIYPQDLEEALFEIPGVIPGRGLALGAADDEKGTENLVIIAESHETDESARRKIQRAIYQQMTTRFECSPADIQIVDHGWLLKTTSGKISRPANLQKYLDVFGRMSAAAGPAAAGEVLAEDQQTSADIPDADRLLGCINAILWEKNIAATIDSLDQPLISSGLIDSLSLVSLILKIEQTFSVTIPPEWLDLYYMDLPERILEVIEKLRAGSAQDASLQPEKYASFRDFKTAKFPEREDGIDLLLVGSSKIREFLPALAADYGSEGYNFWVKSSRAEDWYCILRFVMDTNKSRLQHVLIGIDVEAFTNASSTDLRLLQNPTLSSYLDEIHSDDTLSPAEPEDSDPSVRNRFQTVLLQYKHGLINQMRDHFTFDPKYGNAVKPRKECRFELPLRDLAVNVLRMRGFTALHPMRIQYFMKILELCKQHTIRITCFLTPLHRALDQYLREHTDYGRRLDDLRELMRQIHLPGFLFLDTPTVATFGGNEDDFVDEAHLGPCNSDTMMKYVLEKHYQNQSPETESPLPGLFDPAVDEVFQR